jgi:hypothetical protein
MRMEKFLNKKIKDAFHGLIKPNPKDLVGLTTPVRKTF